MISRTNQLRIERKAPVDNVTTGVEAYPVRDGGTEVVVWQTRFKNFEKKWSPRKMLTFVLTPEQRRELIALLSEGEQP